MESGPEGATLRADETRAHNDSASSGFGGALDSVTFGNGPELMNARKA